MLKRAIENWANEKIYYPEQFNDAYLMFCRDTNINVSKTHFYNIFSNITRIQKIKTGGVYSRSEELVDTIVQRSFFGVNMLNTIAIDEKPIIIKNYKTTSVRTNINHKGKIPSNKVQAFKHLDRLSNLYIICAITYKGVLLYHISETPINTLKFNCFLKRLTTKINNENNCFLLVDNASFHSIDEEIKRVLGIHNLSITRTPPMGCLFNPIEEFFACFDNKLRHKINTFLKKTTEPLSQDIFLEMIHESIEKTVEMDLPQIFRRAGLLEK